MTRAGSGPTPGGKAGLSRLEASCQHASSSAISIIMVVVIVVVITTTTTTSSSRRFPKGMRWLADQMHSRGLKLGIYTCAGTKVSGYRPVTALGATWRVTRGGILRRCDNVEGCHQ
jgi:hypothetical protein